MDFPIREFMDEQRCHDKLFEILHPEGLHCPRCQRDDALVVHDHSRKPVLRYKCCHCNRIFHLFTGTPLAGVRRRSCAELLLLLRGIAKGTPTRELAREVGCSEGQLLSLRHRLQELAKRCMDEGREPLPDQQVEADEMYQNSGAKGELHDDPEDPPRCRGNKRRGQGTFANDRPPVAGVVGRETGEVRLEVVEHADKATLEEFVVNNTQPGATVNTDGSACYNGLPDRGRQHASVNHSQREYARDDDGDGFCEVHDNTMEGIWTGLRNFLRPFRGLNKHFLAGYVAIFEWSHNFKVATDDALRLLLGCPLVPVA
jgi:transposase-like protein